LQGKRSGKVARGTEWAAEDSGVGGGWPFPAKGAVGGEWATGRGHGGGVGAWLDLEHL
jgi:hypothetical protein